jgi:hypothetical protein
MKVNMLKPLKSLEGLDAQEKFTQPDGKPGLRPITVGSIIKDILLKGGTERMTYSSKLARGEFAKRVAMGPAIQELKPDELQMIRKLMGEHQTISACVAFEDALKG